MGTASSRTSLFRIFLPSQEGAKSAAGLRPGLLFASAERDNVSIDISRGARLCAVRAGGIPPPKAYRHFIIRAAWVCRREWIQTPAGNSCFKEICETTVLYYRGR